MQNNLSVAVLTSELDRLGLDVWDAKAAVRRPIPVALTPVTVSKTEWAALLADARMLLTSFPLLLRWLQKSEQKPLWDALFSRLEGVEAWAAAVAEEQTWGHATIRLDLFWHHDQLRIIEANCTIPAMQAYSDMVQGAWLKAAGSPPGFLSASSSNSDDLLESLLSLYRRNGGVESSPVVLILHREGDSQIAELKYHARRWNKKRAVKVVLATPDQCYAKENYVYAAGQRIDVIYRHIFAWRLEGHPDLQAALQENRRYHVYNPISAHYEVKGFFALLSQVADSDELSRAVGFSAQQREAIRSRLPWTRLLPSKNVRGAFTSLPVVCDHVETYVVKNSLGYGGQQVLVGSEWFTEEVQSRLVKLLGRPGPVRPDQFFDWIVASSDDTWIVQERMTGRRHRSQVLTSRREIVEVNGFVDASVFLNTGDRELCGGGVSRFAAGPVVNIGTGGGLAPFFIV